MSAVEDARTRLGAYMAARGLKHTRQRDVILECFFGVGGHVSVDELVRIVQERMDGVGTATIYRALRLFSDAGVAAERRFQDGQTRYEPVTPDEHHDHLICVDCGRIFEFEDPVIEERQSAVAAQYGLTVRSHRHEIYGSCGSPGSCPHRP